MHSESITTKAVNEALNVFINRKKELEEQLENVKYRQKFCISQIAYTAYIKDIAELSEQLDTLERDIENFINSVKNIPGLEIKYAKAEGKQVIPFTKVELATTLSKDIIPINNRGPRFITKIPTYEKFLYETAVREYNSPDLYIRDNALFCRGYKDLSGFWEIVRELQAEFDTYTAAIADFFNCEKKSVEDFEKEVQEGFVYAITISDGTTEKICTELTANQVARCIYSGKGYIVGYDSTKGRPRGFQKFIPGADVIIVESCYENKTTEYPIKDIMEAYRSKIMQENAEKENSEYE